MDELLTKIIQGIVDLGGPGALIGALFIVLYVIERRRNDKMVEKYIALTREAITAVSDGASANEKLQAHGDEMRSSLSKVADAVTMLSMRGRRG